MDKFILTILLTSGIPGLVLFSCKCENEDTHWQPESIKQIEGYYNGIPVSDSTQVDSINNLWFEVHFDIVYAQSDIENTPLPLSSFFTPNLNATPRCPDPGHLGLLIDLQDIIITCNQPYQEIDAGDRLDDKLIIGNDTIQSTGLSPILEEFNQGRGDYNPLKGLSFRFTEKPNVESFKIFTVLFVFETGTILQGQTPGVIL